LYNNNSVRADGDCELCYAWNEELEVCTQDEDLCGTGHGDESVSETDITITKKIVEAGKLFDIAVLDHLIIGAGYYSFADNGMV
jgi:hypothetical protein